MRLILLIPFIAAATGQYAGYLQAEESVGGLDLPADVPAQPPAPIPASFEGFGNVRGLSAWQQRWADRFQREPQTLEAYRNRAQRGQQRQRLLANLGGRLGGLGQGGLFGQAGLGQAGLGQAGLGLGQQGLGLGQGVLGLGQGSLGLGQNALGLGQASLGNAALANAPSGLGQGAAGLGQGAASLGQGAAGLGQAGLGLGSNVLNLGQGTLGLGQQGLGLGQGVIGGLGNNQWYQNYQQQRLGRLAKWRQGLEQRSLTPGGAGEFGLGSNFAQTAVYPQQYEQYNDLRQQSPTVQQRYPLANVQDQSSLSSSSAFPGYPSPAALSERGIREGLKDREGLNALRNLRQRFSQGVQRLVPSQRSLLQGPTAQYPSIDQASLGLAGGRAGGFASSLWNRGSLKKTTRA